MISLSHWGMFKEPMHYFMVPGGYKLNEEDLAELQKPDGFVRMEPLKPGEPQRIYQRLNFGPDLS